MTGDCHAGICGSPGVRFPRATRPIDCGLGGEFRCVAAGGVWAWVSRPTSRVGLFHWVFRVEGGQVCWR